MLSKENNVGLLNFHWENNNYGALLTAYALNKYINSLGYNAYNIDYVPSWGKIVFQPPIFLILGLNICP